MDNIRKIKIKTLSNCIYNLEVSSTITIGELKEEIFKQSQVQVQNQRLVYMGKLLINSEKLENIIKDDDQTILMMANTIQQSQNQPQNQNPQQNVNQDQRPIQTSLNFINIPNLQQQSRNISSNLTQIISDFINPRIPQTNQQPQQAQQNQQPQQIQAQNLQNQSQRDPNIHQQGSSTVQLNLPHRYVQELGLLCNQLMGPQSAFPGPTMPQLQMPRNCITLLGGYMNQYQFAIQRALPFLQRTAQLMQRESLMNDANSRQQMQQMASSMGSVLELITKMSISVAQIFRELQIGDQPGQFQLNLNMPNILQQYQGVINETYIRNPFESQNVQPDQPDNNNVQTFINNQNFNGNQENLNLQQQQEQQIPVIATVEMDIDFDQNPQIEQAGMAIIDDSQDMQPNQFNNMINNLINQVSSGFGQNVRVSVQNLINQDNQSNLQSQNMHQQQNVQTQDNQNQQNLQQNIQQNNNQNYSQNNQQQQQRQPQNLFTLTLGDLITQNYSASLDENDMDFLQIFGCIKVTEIMSLNTSIYFIKDPSTEFLNSYKNQFKQGLQKIKQKYSNDRQKMIQQLAKGLIVNFYSQSQDNPSFYEGVEPEVICQDILEKYVDEIITLIEQDNNPMQFFNARFNEQFINSLNQMIGQVPYELSQALPNGMQDYQKIFQISFQKHIAKINLPPNVKIMIEPMLKEQTWIKIQQCFAIIEKSEQERAEKQKLNMIQQQNISEESQDLDSESCQNQDQSDKMEPKQEDVIILFKLKNLIKSTVSQDINQFPQYLNVQLSDNYKLGDPFNE